MISYCCYFRLQYLVFDDAQILFKYRWDQLKTILNAFKTYVDKIGHRKCLCQTVVCGSQWGPEMEISFADLSDNPVLMISSPVQAIRYGRFGIQVVEVSAETKFECLKGMQLLVMDIMISLLLMTLEQNYFVNFSNLGTTR